MADFYGLAASVYSYNSRILTLEGGQQGYEDRITALEKKLSQPPPRALMPPPPPPPDYGGRIARLEKAVEQLAQQKPVLFKAPEAKPTVWTRIKQRLFQ